MFCTTIRRKRQRVTGQGEAGEGRGHKYRHVPNLITGANQRSFRSGASEAWPLGAPFGQAVGNNYPDGASKGYLGAQRGILAGCESALVCTGS